MKTYFLWLLSLLSLLLTSSCKKDSRGNPNSCRIIAVYDTTNSSNGTNSTFDNQFSYDKDGRISSIKFTAPTGSETQNFTYSGNLMVAVRTRSQYSADSIFFNSQGLPDKAVFVELNSIAQVSTYSYNSDGQIRTSTDINPYPQPLGANPYGMTTTYTYVYSNGDLLTKTDNSGNVYTYSYFTDKAAADGDVLRLSDLMNLGLVFVRNAHVVKSQQANSTLEKFSYSFDSSGKIITATATSDDYIKKFTIEYDCSH
ncbi:MAG TPA: hypothetical protein VK518_21465 [Puia sp.]|nr:hypothetical protein [Puia sp.]